MSSNRLRQADEDDEFVITTIGISAGGDIIVISS